MSASSKKKLRKEAAAAALTEKQKQERAEVKKLKAITVSFVVIMLAIVLTAGAVLTVRTVNNSGVIDRNTIAAVTGEHELNSIQMNYYFTDYVQNMYQQWQSSYGDSVSLYLSMMGLDLNTPLDKQQCAMDSSLTWAEYFLEGALEKARTDFALYDKAMADPDFKLSDEETSALESNTTMLEFYAIYSGYSSADKYLQAIYGYGADVESYNKYSEIATIASSYYNAYSDSLTYNAAAIDEYGTEHYDEYSSFSYALYTVYVSDYLTDGTEAEDGTVTYTDDQQAAALKEAEQIADQLNAAESLEALDKAISELEINAESESAASTKNDSVKYTDLPSDFQEWLANADRENGDITVIPNKTTSTDADGNETETVTSFYVLCFTERNDNLRPLANVRHLLVAFEGGTTDSSGNTTYSDTEKATAKAEAERLLQVWLDGDATEESFIALVQENSDDSSAETGGLFEDIHPESSYVDSFLAWSLDTARKAGDTGVIVSDYGYHVMYYSSDDALTYRDYMITEDLRSADVEAWYDAIIEPVTITVGKTNRLNLDMIIANLG